MLESFTTNLVKMYTMYMVSDRFDISCYLEFFNQARSLMFKCAYFIKWLHTDFEMTNLNFT